MTKLYHILIAEDDPSLLLLLQRMIKRCYADAIIHSFTDGRQALRDYEEHTADMLITNCHMPHMDGPVLIRILRERGVTIPILGLSGNPLNEMAFHNAGANAYIESPFTLTDFQTLVYRLLPD